MYIEVEDKTQMFPHGGHTTVRYVTKYSGVRDRQCRSLLMILQQSETLSLETNQAGGDYPI